MYVCLFNDNGLRFSEKKNVERKEEHRQTDEWTNRQIDE
jgi:hypothetical protein